jgi:hypothetical protein
MYRCYHEFHYSNTFFIVIVTELYGADLPPGILQSSLNFKYAELKKATDNFNLSNKLGQGSYGAVFKVMLERYSFR